MNKAPRTTAVRSPLAHRRVLEDAGRPVAASAAACLIMLAATGCNRAPASPPPPATELQPAAEVGEPTVTGEVLEKSVEGPMAGFRRRNREAADRFEGAVRAPFAVARESIDGFLDHLMSIFGARGHLILDVIRDLGGTELAQARFSRIFEERVLSQDGFEAGVNEAAEQLREDLAASVSALILDIRGSLELKTDDPRLAPVITPEFEEELASMLAKKLAAGFGVNLGVATVATVAMEQLALRVMVAATPVPAGPVVNTIKIVVGLIGGFIFDHFMSKREADKLRPELMSQIDVMEAAALDDPGGLLEAANGEVKRLEQTAADAVEAWIAEVTK